jgi:DNA-binding NarL/FixJ family response regulator
MSEVVRVLIADDHPVVRSGIRGMLAPDPGIEIVARPRPGRTPSPSRCGSGQTSC